MKKFLTFCAVILAAMSMNAQITEMTCAEAVSAIETMANDSVRPDSVAITGYVTKSLSGISKGQQRFWIDDAKGTKQTVQSYYCTLPQGETSPLIEGDKVKLLGRLQNYNGTPEVKNGDVVILERANIKIDTTEVSICDAIEEGQGLNANDHTLDYFIVRGIVTEVVNTKEEYKQQTFWLDCNDSTRLEAYAAILQDAVDSTLAGYAAKGDSVEVLGQITHFVNNSNEHIIEMTSAKFWVLAKGEPEKLQRLTVAEAKAMSDSLARKEKTRDDYIVIGYVDSIITPYDTTYHNLSFFICDDMNNPTYNFQVYRGAFNADIPVGTKVYCVGKIQHFYKEQEGENPEQETSQMASGAKVYLTDPELQNAITIIKADKPLGKKVFENGQIFIIKGDAKYTVLGVEVK